MTDATYLPPQNLEMEQAVLGSVLISRDARDAVAETSLKASDFYRESHALIFDAYTYAAESGKVDELTVSSVLQDRGKLEQVGGTVALYTLTERVPAVANARVYAEEVIEQARRRWLVKVGTKIARLGYDQESGSSTDLISQAAELIAGIDPGDTEDWVLLDDELAPLYDDLMDRFERGVVAGLPTGFASYDDLVGGLHPGELLVVAARPGMGKSAWATNVAEHVTLELGQHVAFETLEMTAREVTSRVVSSIAKVSGRRLRQSVPDDADFKPVMDAMAKIRTQAPGRFHIGASGSTTPATLRGKVRRLARKLERERSKLSLVIVDYIGLVDSDTEDANRANEVAKVTKALKGMALELGIPVMALSQLSRNCEYRTDKRPMLSDLRESGAVEQDANTVVFLYRDDYYNPETTDAPGVAEVIVAKNRNGWVGKVAMDWKPQYTRFVDRGVA